MATSSSPTSVISRVQAACATCVRGGKRFVGRYRAFLLDPGTLFTLVSLLLDQRRLLFDEVGAILVGLYFLGLDQVLLLVELQVDLVDVVD